jgi:hypothetical protein
VSRTIRKRKSQIFKNIKEEYIKNTEQEFVVYFDKRDNEIRFSTKDEFDYKSATMKSAIKDRNTFRGFNLSKINQRHRISQGYYANSFMNVFSYYDESDTESNEIPLSKDDSNLFSAKSMSELSTPNDFMTTNFLSSVYRNEKSEAKTKFDVSSGEINVIHEEASDDSDTEQWEISDSSITDRQWTTSRMHRKSMELAFNNFSHYSIISQLFLKQNFTIFIGYEEDEIDDYNVIFYQRSHRKHDPSMIYPKSEEESSAPDFSE